MRVSRLLFALVLSALWSAAARSADLLGLVDTGELFRSADGGVTWTAHATLPIRDAVGLAARSTSDDLFLASRSGSVYRSIDGGANWSATGTVAATDVADLSVLPDLSLRLLTETGDVYQSADLGISFSPLSTIAASDLVSLAFTTPDVRLYALARTGGVWESTDNGATWTAQGAISISDGVEIRSLGLTLHVMTGTGDIYRSIDRGVTWSAIGTLSQSGMTALVGDGSKLVAATAGGEVASSNDGTSWIWRGVINQLTLRALATDAPASTAVIGPPVRAGRVALGTPRPNPARGAAAVWSVWLERDDVVQLELFDIKGRRVSQRSPEALSAGIHDLPWTPRLSGLGLYVIRLTTASGDHDEVRWVLIR